MSVDILCCAKCQQPLKIVCDEHGEHYTPCRRLAPPEPPATTRRRKRGVVATKILSAFNDREYLTLDQLATRTGLTYDHVAVEMSAQLKRGTVRRVARGVYAKSTEGVL